MSLHSATHSYSSGACYCWTGLDWYRYDRCFAPNVALSVEPFEEVRKQRAAECLATMEDSAVPDGGIGGEVLSPAAKRRRHHQRHDRQHATALTDDYQDDEDDDDRESVSSDKRESVPLCLQCSSGTAGWASGL